MVPRWLGRATIYILSTVFIAFAPPAIAGQPGWSSGKTNQTPCWQRAEQDENGENGLAGVLESLLSTFPRCFKASDPWTTDWTVRFNSLRLSSFNRQHAGLKQLTGPAAAAADGDDDAHGSSSVCFLFLC